MFRTISHIHGLHLFLPPDAREGVLPCVPEDALCDGRSVTLPFDLHRLNDAPPLGVIRDLIPESPIAANITGSGC